MDNLDIDLNVKKIFDEECSHLKIDAALIRRINDFQVAFVNKNEDHMTFFGGNLTGVKPIRFTSTDKTKWFTDVIMADDITLEERLLLLPTINENFHISSDVFNLSVVWVMHFIFNSHLLSDKQKEQGMMDAALSLNYKFLTSLLYQYFKYDADPGIAAATYAQLSYKFALKQHGNWYSTLRFRSESLIGHSSIHYNTFKKFNNDVQIVYCLNDTQGRIRDMLKNIYREFMKVHGAGKKIVSTSSTVEFDGEEILKDKTKSLVSYNRYIRSIISDQNSLLKDDLLVLINNVQHTMPPKLLVKTLIWVSANYRHTGAPEIERFLDLTLTHSFAYMAGHQNTVKENNDLASFMASLRGVYMSSRSTDVELLEVRKIAEEIVVKATGTKNDSVIASVRTGLLLYIVLRSFLKN